MHESDAKDTLRLTHESLDRREFLTATGGVLASLSAWDGVGEAGSQPGFIPSGYRGHRDSNLPFALGPPERESGWCCLEKSRARDHPGTPAGRKFPASITPA